MSAELRDLVHERTEGGPFFTEEVIDVTGRGAILPTDSGWDVKAVTEIVVPQSVRAVVGQRAGHRPGTRGERRRLTAAGT